MTAHTTQHPGTPSHRFLDLFARPSRAAPWDEILLETQHFVVVPTRGSLVEGWLLVIPKRWRLCMADLEDQEYEELIPLLDDIKSTLRECYGNGVILWETGPCREDTRTGCGVDHAHIHLVPWNRNILRSLDDYRGQITSWLPANSVRDTRQFHQNNIPYIYFDSDRTGPLVMDASEIPSQYFRQVIAYELGIPNEYDWKTHPKPGTARSTVLQLRGKLQRQK